MKRGVLAPFATGFVQYLAEVLSRCGFNDDSTGRRINYHNLRSHVSDNISNVGVTEFGNVFSASRFSLGRNGFFGPMNIYFRLIKACLMLLL